MSITQAMANSPPITLRLAEPEDLLQVANLDRLAFAPLKSTETIAQEWYSQGLNLPGQQIFLGVDDQTGASVSCYSQLALNIHHCGKVLPAMGLGGVAVAPERRGQGVAQLMLEHALQMARSQRLPLVMLYPFQPGFYRKLGWAWVGQTRQYRIATRHLPAYCERTGILAYHPDHLARLKAVYQQAAQHENGWLQRPDWHWQKRLKAAPGKECYLYQDAGQILGYVIFHFTHLNPPQNLLAVNIQEWVALTNSAYRGILGFLASLRDQVDTVIWNTYPNDPFPHLLQEQQQDVRLGHPGFDFGLVDPLGEIGSGFMWRLVDLEMACQQRQIRLGLPFELTFEVSDRILGDQTLTLKFSNGQMQLTDTPVANVVKISIEHFTQLFAGVRQAHELVWTGELEFTGNPDRLSALDASWQTAAPFCWDFF
jgi:predicted acetyltransferase